MTESFLPQHCPSCQSALEITHLHCQECETKIEGQYALPAILSLSKDEQQFLLDFAVHRGSPLHLSESYQVSYTTIRTRITKLIERITSMDD